MREWNVEPPFDIVVNSGSMLPFLRQGDLVRVEKAGKIRKGDVVLARTDEGVVLHRVEKILEGALLLSGTFNLYRRETCRRSEVIGQVRSFERAGRRLSLSFWLRVWPEMPLLRRILLKAYKLGQT